MEPNKVDFEEWMTRQQRLVDRHDLRLLLMAFVNAAIAYCEEHEGHTQWRAYYHTGLIEAYDRLCDVTDSGSPEPPNTATIRAIIRGAAIAAGMTPIEYIKKALI